METAPVMDRPRLDADDDLVGNRLSRLNDILRGRQRQRWPDSKSEPTLRELTLKHPGLRDMLTLPIDLEDEEGHIVQTVYQQVYPHLDSWSASHLSTLRQELGLDIASGDNLDDISTCTNPFAVYTCRACSPSPLLVGAKAILDHRHSDRSTRHWREWPRDHRFFPTISPIPTRMSASITDMLAATNCSSVPQMMAADLRFKCGYVACTREEGDRPRPDRISVIMTWQQMVSPTRPTTSKKRSPYCVSSYRYTTFMTGSTSRQRRPSVW
jgi:hypothetical protein